MQNKIFEYIDAQASLVVSLQADLTGIPAIGPDSEGEGEEAKAIYLMRQLHELGFPPCVELNAPDSRVPCGYRPNFYTLIPGEDRSRTFWIVGHMDVVPPGDLALWKTDPYTLKVEGDHIYGRGVEDNQQAIVSAIIALKAFIEHNITPPCNVALLCVSDEETNNHYGAEYLVNNHPNLFGPNDVALVPDFGVADASMLEVAEKGVLWLKIIVEGRQCHASTPREGVNSLVAASELVLRLNGLNKIFTEENALFTPHTSTFVPTRKEANVPNVNTMPGRDVFYMDCRLLPGLNADSVLEKTQEICVAAERELGVAIKIEIVERRESAPASDPEHPFIKSIAAAVQRVYGVLPKPEGVGGNTVAVYFRRLGLPCAVWARLAGTAHMPNEYSHISWNLGDAKVISSFLLNYK